MVPTISPRLLEFGMTVVFGNTRKLLCVAMENSTPKIELGEEGKPTDVVKSHLDRPRYDDVMNAIKGNTSKFHSIQART